MLFNSFPGLVIYLKIKVKPGSLQGYSVFECDFVNRKTIYVWGWLDVLRVSGDLAGKYCENELKTVNKCSNNLLLF